MIAQILDKGTFHPMTLVFEYTWFCTQSQSNFRQLLLCTQAAPAGPPSSVTNLHKQLNQ